MVVKLSPLSRRHCAILFSVYALLACVAVAMDSHVPVPENLDRSERRLLRVYRGNQSLRTLVGKIKNDDSGERAISDAVKKVAQAAKKKLMSNNQATTNKLFKKLQVTEADETLFRSSQFENWATTVTKNFKKNTELAQASIASSLASHFGDEALAKLLVMAKQNDQSKTVAAQLENAQLQNWERAGKTGDDIFDLLKLYDEGEKLFESPMAATWISYVTQLKKQNFGEGIFSSLKKRYDDESLAKMIEGARNSVDTVFMGNKLRHVQLTKWSNEGKTVDDIFELLKLNNRGEKLLQSPLLRTWTAYVKLQGKNPYDLLLVNLSTYYDEISLAKLLVAAQQNDKTSRIGRKLEEVEFKSWQSDGKSANDVYNLLKLNLERDNILNSPILTIWISYTTRLDQNPYQLLLGQLMKRYNDEGLAKMIASAKGNHKTRLVAVNLEELLLKQWMRNGKSSDDVYNLLKLNIEGDDILKSPMLNTWISYTAKLNENPYPLLMAYLMKRYDDATLTKMFVTPKGGYITGTIGIKLEEVQLKIWLSGEKTADDVFKLLQLNKEGVKVFASPVWSVWISFLKKLNRENSDELMFVVLKKHYGDGGVTQMITFANKEASTKSIARTLEEELWRSQGKDGGDIFKLLKLDEEGNNFFESPALSSWISYVTRLNNKTPDAISQLEKRFGGDVKLARMIGRAEQQVTSEATKKAITQLRDLQFKKWMATGVTPQSISAKMVLNTKNTKVLLDYSDFYKANAARAG